MVVEKNKNSYIKKIILSAIVIVAALGAGSFLLPIIIRCNLGV